MWCNSLIPLLLLTVSSSAQQPALSTNPSVSAIDKELSLKLLNARRVFVDSFGDDAVSKSLAATVLDAIRTSKRYIITENRDKADLILKGTALEKTTQEFHALGSATSVAGASGAHSATVNGTAHSVSGSSSGGFVSRAAAIEDSQASTETIENARLAVRLVTPDGDVVWSNTQESRGAKYKSSAADVADRVMKDLVRELEKLAKAAGDLK
jgi:hypothetical protein